VRESAYDCVELALRRRTRLRGRRLCCPPWPAIRAAQPGDAGALPGAALRIRTGDEAKPPSRLKRSPRTNPLDYVYLELDDAARRDFTSCAVRRARRRSSAGIAGNCQPTQALGFGLGRSRSRAGPHLARGESRKHAISIRPADDLTTPQGLREASGNERPLSRAAMVHPDLKPRAYGAHPTDGRLHEVCPSRSE